MQMLYNSDNFVVVQMDVPEHLAARGEGPLLGGGYEIVDKFAKKEIFLQGDMAQHFKDGVEALIRDEPSEEELDDFIGRFTTLAQQPVILH
ncbi:DUF3567 domain-containing protein [Aquabacterium sp. J223]|jgi:hypothetical protein|uniref:BTH_I0359 family protein n=1 Tax=Aquabacterium sp. J223 TaxID=2898431 RepID=UPI0021ADBCB8|nr:DUF3567 domain-containing protein [Aquabacterium sp. J223]UUX96296.1 DUF3567 domain-containing protein [Aquabacterium sp. J223]